MSCGIVVLGMHRSGTSLVAEMLHRAGIFGRVQECLPANEWNEHGYWELAELVEFNERLLREVDSDWILPPGADENKHLAALADKPSYREQALRLLSGMRKFGAQSWFWKDPRLSLLLPFWQRIWGDVRYVICVRDPREVSDSLARRDGFSARLSLKLWQSYLLTILDQTRDRTRLFVHYERILQHPRQESGRLAQFLFGREGSFREASSMERAVDGGLRHSSEWVHHGRLSQKNRELYEKLSLMAADSEQDLSHFKSTKGWRTALKADLLALRFTKRGQRLLGLPNGRHGLGAGNRLLVTYSKGAAASAYEFE